MDTVALNEALDSTKFLIEWPRKWLLKQAKDFYSAAKRGTDRLKNDSDYRAQKVALYEQWLRYFWACQRCPSKFELEPLLVEQVYLALLLDAQFLDEAQLPELYSTIHELGRIINQSHEQRRMALHKKAGISVD